MFFGREKELAILKHELTKDSSAVLIYGKRKIGKTTLINKACENISDKQFVYYECIKDTEENNVLEIIKLFRVLNLIPEGIVLSNNTFIDLFTYINSLNKKFIIAIDEYPYLKEFASSKTVDSVFQNIIDNRLKNINLVISGSHIAMMKDLLEEKNALFGRFNTIIHLKELSYREASQFYPNLSSYEKVAFYSVFGGSPYINEQLNPSLGLSENVINLLLNNNSPAYIYASSLLISDLSNQIHANRILSTLGNGKKSYSELEEVLDKNKNGLLSKQLKPLLEMELIKKESPINKINDPKKSKYEINDNLLRFYYTYISSNQYLINYKSSSMIYKEEIEPSIITYISHRFEDICRDYIWLYINQNNVLGVKNVGRYYYDDSINKSNGEFDVAILNKNNSVQIIEAKYLSKKVDQKVVDKELSQIANISELKVDKVGFVSINGFESNIVGLDYMFDGDDLYQ